MLDPFIDRGNDFISIVTLDAPINAYNYDLTIDLNFRADLIIVRLSTTEHDRTWVNGGYLQQLWTYENTDYQLSFAKIYLTTAQILAIEPVAASKLYFKPVGHLFNWSIEVLARPVELSLSEQLNNFSQSVTTKLATITANVQTIADSLDVDLSPKDLYKLRINIGGQDYTDTEGHLWLGRQLPEYEGTYRTHEPIADPNSPLFESSLNAIVAGYSDLSAPDGQYQISFLAQEWYRNDPDIRFIDIYINGVMVEQGLNIWTEAGGQYKPLTKTYTVDITGGLSIEARGQDGRPIIICALEILQLN